jgi:uncharacterized protein with HEPN domain
MLSEIASMSERGNRDWLFYIDDMIGFAEKVIKYTAGLEESEFTERGLVYDGVLRNLELIGEAATHIPSDVRERHAEIPWRLIIATRNRLIHGYLGVDDETLWSIVKGDVVALLPRLITLQDEGR